MVGEVTKMVRSEIKKMLRPLESANTELCDLFAAGCALHFLGHQRAGQQACNAVLRALAIEEPLFSKIMRGIPGNESEFAHAVRPHSELLNPFQSG
jgi:hypothetical protein